MEKCWAGSKPHYFLDEYNFLNNEVNYIKIRMKMKKLLPVLLTLLYILGSCTNESAEMMKLQQIDSLMEKNPQAAYDSLCYHKKEWLQKGGRKVEMKYRLLMVKAENKLFLPLPSDSLFQEVVTYYDSKGSSNDRMQVHYLLGCVYRDQKEAPKAIQCYQQAVENADTLSAGCDYTMLFKVYGQMASLYTQQNLLDEALAANGKYSDYALKVGDYYNFLIGKEQRAALFYQKGDTAQAIRQIWECVASYRKHNMLKEAVGIYPLLIDICNKQQQFGKAYHYMQIFERESGLFDKNGEICRGREYYYNAKGQYFLGVNQLDSAKYYFKKLDGFGFHYEANRGLFAVCCKLQDWKQVARYAASCEQGMDDILNANQANALMQASKMYDFQKMQKRMADEALVKERMERNLFLLMLAMFLMGTLCLYGWKQYRKRLRCKQAELERSKEELQLRVLQLGESKKEVEVQNDRYLKTLRELEAYKEKYQRMNSSEKTVMIDDNEIYKKFKKKGAGFKCDAFPTDKHWRRLTIMVGENFPLFFDRISHNHVGKNLTLTEQRVAMLTRLHFTSSEMANVMDVSPASVSNAKLSANEKLYGDKNARTLLQNMLKA